MAADAETVGVKLSFIRRSVRGLLNPFGRLSKSKKLKQILLPANNLHRF